MDLERLGRTAFQVSCLFNDIDPRLILLHSRYFIDQPAVAVNGKPSAALPDKLEADEKVRIAAQKERLGEEGLKKLVKELEEAKKEHEKPIPKEMLTSFPVPDVASISWIPVQSARNDPAKSGSLQANVVNSGSDQLEKHIAADDAQLPFFVGYDHVQVRFYV